MVHRESWKPIYFGVRGQGHEIQNIASVGHGALVGASLKLSL